MFFYLSKFLEFLLDPFIWVFLILLFTYFKSSSKATKQRILSAVILLYLFSNQFIFNEFSLAWEMEARSKQSLKPKYEVAVVLGGIASQNERNQQIEFGDNADRILSVLPLYFEGQVEKILLSGGSGRMVEAEKEATILENYLLKIGVKAEDIIIEKQSRNTFENAAYSVKKLKELGIINNILLSTSATHMKRSYLCFKKQGLEVDPFPTDHKVTEREFYFDTLFLPQSSILSDWYWLIHEWLGILIYRVAGYC